MHDLLKKVFGKTLHHRWVVMLLFACLFMPGGPGKLMKLFTASAVEATEISRVELLRVVPLSGVNQFEFNSLTTTIQAARGTGTGGLPHSLVIDSIPGPSSIDSEASTTYTLTVTDSYAHPLTFAWTSSCSGLSSNGSFTDARVQNPTWTAPENSTGSAGDCTISVDVDDGSFGLTVSGSFTQSVETATGPLTVVGTTLPLLDNDASASTTIYIVIDPNGIGTNTLKAEIATTSPSQTAFSLTGTGGADTATLNAGSSFTLISPTEGSTIPVGSNTIVVQRNSDSSFFQVTVDFDNEPVLDPGDTNLKSLSGYNCGSNQSNCP